MRATSVFIAACWILWLGYWLVMAVGAKRTVEREGFMQYRLISALVVVALVLLARLVHVSADSHLWRRTLAVGVVSDCIVAAGLAFTVWARITLAGNWSMEVTFKQDHELIESGPYALVRHPIYTGLITMALGTAIDYGRLSGFGLLVALCAGLWWKSRQEERIMSRHFPAYPEYRKRVRALIPFVL